ncbi:ATP-grasp domain-containing protein [Mannheimia massilioguelmaensis]|uniref:ATP-grasp domain-containing protein n=1 Tax=Pasteurellaceae TaxID=712 RepID=UPI0005CAEFE5|nr:RimK family alpha-L-glutamate ligase [Mannheimia massilioguelmaensis]
MKLLMLCREPRLYSCQRLKEAAEHSGHQIDILDPNRFLMKIQENEPHFLLYYQPNSETEPYLLPEYDAVLPRFGTQSTKTGCALLAHFAAKHIPCLNEENAFAIARDKWKSLQVLMQAKVSVPATVLSGIEYSANQTIKQVSSPAILKTLNGSQGIGVILADRPQSAVSILETLKLSNVPVLMQDFIEEASASDIRCFVIGNNVIASMQRHGQHGEFRANCHRGGLTQKITLSDEQKNIAVRASQALGLDVAGVDLIPSKRGLLVLEVNASPGLEMIEKTSGIDIAAQMIAYLEKKVSCHKN